MSDARFTWKNFRGFHQTTSFDVPRITLLIGRNNVGKTSTYAPLLMLKQTLDASNPETALLGRGSLFDAGSFRDYVSDHNADREVLFDIELPGMHELVFRQRSVRLSNLQLGFRSTDGQTAYLSRQKISQAAKSTPVINRSRTDPESSFNVTSDLLPTRAGGRPYKELTDLRAALIAEQPEGFMFEGYGALLLPKSAREDRDRWAAVQDWYNAAYDLYEVQSRLNLRLRAFLQGISYVGPLRSLPQRTYRLAAEAPTDVGAAGEFAPEVLFRLRDQEEGDLVDRWLNALGYGHLKFDELSDEYFQVFVESPSGTRVNIADSGIGLSQVTPLFVQGALAKAGDTVIAQQPEIHLNPAQQSVVTDFLIDRAAQGVRVLIESHSEHILLRLRRRIAEGELDASSVAVYFVDNVAGATRIERVPIGPLAEIGPSVWPVGFFEEQLQDSFALALAQSRRATDHAA